MEKNINTERLILREIDESDANEIVKWRSTEDVFKFFKSPHKLSVDEHMNWFRNFYQQNKDRLDFMCLTKDNQHKIGVFGLVLDVSSAEINYILAPEAQHHGYAQEAVIALMSFAQNNWDIDRFMAEIHKDNEPSIKLIEKLGFNKLFETGCFLTFYKNIG